MIIWVIPWAIGKYVQSTHEAGESDHAHGLGANARGGREARIELGFVCLYSSASVLCASEVCCE
jgi:hypothetical protein